MKNNQKSWKELIELNKEEIYKVGKEAYKDALIDNHLRYIVEMDDEGNIWTWYDVAGGNSFTQSSFNGESIQLFSFCFQHQDIEIDESIIIDKLEEEGITQDKIKEIQELSEENYNTLEEELKEDDILYYIIDEIVEEEIEFVVDEYAQEEIDNKLDYLLEMLELEE